MKNKFRLLLVIFLSLLLLTGCTQKQTSKTIENKTDAELSYLEDKVFAMVNKYVKNEYVLQTNIVEENTDEDIVVSEEIEGTNTSNLLNWSNINEDAKKINSEVDTIILDLSELQISESDILELSNQINSLIISISEENDKVMIDRLSYIYSFVPRYLSSYSNNGNMIKQKELKSIILSTLNLSNLERWEEAKFEVQNAESMYINMMNDVDYMNEFEYNLNKVYVLLEEFKNAINLENFELVKIKYIKLIESI